MKKLMLIIAIMFFLFLPGCSKKEQKQQIELGDLLVWFMLDKNEDKPDWTMRSNSINIPLVWNDDGVKDNYVWGELIREGSARVAVNKRILWALKSKKEEIQWKVSLEGSKFGVQKVKIIPNDECFNVAASGCDFKREEIFLNTANKNIKAAMICSDNSGNALYEIKVIGKQDAYVMYGETSGSGGTTNWVELWWKIPGATNNSQAACNHLKEIIQWDGKNKNDRFPDNLELPRETPRVEAPISTSNSNEN